MSNVTLTAPAGISKVSAGDAVYLVVNGKVTVPGAHVSALLEAGFSIGPVLETDANGNVIANIVPRTGLLSDLLALDGGNGEISVATDKRALVQHNGVVGGALPFYPSQRWFEISTMFGSVSIPSGTAGAPVPLMRLIAESNDLDPFGVISVNGIEVSLPVDSVSASATISINATLTFGPSAAGTFRKLAVELYDGTAWSELDSIQVPAAANAVINFNRQCIGGGIGWGADGMKLRFVASQDSGAADTSVGGQIHMTIFRVKA